MHPHGMQPERQEWARTLQLVGDVCCPWHASPTSSAVATARCRLAVMAPGARSRIGDACGPTRIECHTPFVELEA